MRTTTSHLTVTRLLISFAVAMLILSCEGDNRKIDYKETIDTASVIDDRIRDTTKMLVAELPVRFDSTDMLLFAIELVDLDARGGYKTLASSSSSSADLTSSYFSRDDWSGNFINIVFQNQAGEERKLTDVKLRIRGVTFLRDIFKRTRTGYLLYSIYDRDSNGDKELDQSDLEALYISKIDGSDFKKLTKELHDVHDWSTIKGENRVYYRTLEDRNKDGELTNQDKFHYYFIEFSGDKYAVIEYDPVRIFE